MECFQEVSLIAKDEKGCSDTNTKIIKLHPLPKIDFSIDTNICRGEPINMESFTSVDADPFYWSENILKSPGLLTVIQSEVLIL